MNIILATLVAISLVGTTETIAPAEIALDVKPASRMVVEYVKPDHHISISTSTYGELDLYPTGELGTYIVFQKGNELGRIETTEKTLVQDVYNFINIFLIEGGGTIVPLP